MLGKVISELQRDWGTKILGVMAAYRATVHEATSYSTNILMFGRELRAPIDLVLGDQRKSSTPTSTRLWRRFASPNGKLTPWHAITWGGEPRGINIVMILGHARQNLRSVIGSGIITRERMWGDRRNGNEITRGPFGW